MKPDTHPHFRYLDGCPLIDACQTCASARRLRRNDGVNMLAVCEHGNTVRTSSQPISHTMIARNVY
jgi:hypothetical protein